MEEIAFSFCPWFMILGVEHWLKKKPQQQCTALAKETEEPGALELSESWKEQLSSGMLMKLH
jgi:hypothetical protein